ncbi:MAG: hypothetical protein WCR62_03295 [Sulfurospirillaceae bacterium]
MKRILFVFSVLIVFGVVGHFLFANSVEKKIDSHIKELNSSGFIANCDKKIGFLNVVGSGEIEIIYPKKALEYLISKRSDGEFKEYLKESLLSLDEKELELLLDGVLIEYEFTYKNFLNKLNFDMFLVRASNATLSEALKDEELAHLLDFLKNKEVKISFDEDLNFKLKDINYIFKEGSLQLRGVHGDVNGFKVGLFKVSEVANQVHFLVDNIDFKYEESDENINSFLKIDNIKFDEFYTKVKVENLLINSNSIISNGVLDGESKISSDKMFFFQNGESIGFDESEFYISLKKVPYDELKKYSALLNSEGFLESEDFIVKTKEILSKISSSNLSFLAKTNLNNFKKNDEKYFENLNLNADFELAQNLQNLNFIYLKDIFKTVKLNGSLKSSYLTNLLENLPNEIAFLFKDLKFENFDILLDEKGLHLNQELLLDYTFLTL